MRQYLTLFFFQEFPGFETIFNPVLYLGVPRVWEKIEESIKTAGRNNNGLKKAVGDWAKVKNSCGLGKAK